LCVLEHTQQAAGDFLIRLRRRENRADEGCGKVAKQEAQQHQGKPVGIAVW
jgi:hypothetical protein